MSLFGDIFNDGQERPPAPEVAGPDDVEQYNRDFMKHNDIEASRPRANTDPEEAPFAKQDSDVLGRNVKNKADFPWLYDPSRGVRWDFDPIQLRNLAQENTWVGMLVQSITKEIAETPWTIVEADGTTETQKRLTTHPDERETVAKELPDGTAERIHGLLTKPNPDYSWHDMVEQWVGDLLEVGSMTTVKAFNRNAYDGDEFTANPRHVEPRALQASPPEVWTKDYHDKAGILQGFWQFDDHKSPGTGSTAGGSSRSRGMNQPTHFENAEMMWSDMTPRSNRRYGMPPTLLVKDFLESLDLAITQEQEYLSRGSIPSGAWVFEEYDREELKELKTEMNENVKGKPHKSLMFAGRQGDVRFEPMSMNFKELEFTERMRWYARVVSSAFQVPTAVVGIEPEQINYATFQGERENFESNTLGPYLMKLERWINYDLIQPHWGEDYRFEFKPGLSETTREMISSRVSSEVDAGIRSPNEARREIGLEESDEEGADTLGPVEGAGSSDDGGFGEMLASATAKDETEKQTYDDYPEAAVENAQMALDARDETGNPNDCGTDTGWSRANQLANREPLSRETVGRMAAFRRHEDNADQGDDGRENCGWLMWNAWGGEEGVSWAERKMEQIESRAGDSGNSSESVRKDEPLRNTDDFHAFDIQPSDVEPLAEDIAGDVSDLYDRVLEDETIQSIIDRLAAEDDETTSKSLSELHRRLSEIFSESEIVARVESALRDGTAEAAREAIESAIAETDEDPEIDVDRITEQLEDREIHFADSFADSISEDIRATVGDGWAEGKNSREIASEIADQADMSEGWLGAERIARQEMHIAAGEARSEFAEEIGKVEVWNHSGDYPQREGARESHHEMDGAWKFPADNWKVDYSPEGGGVEKESVPGDSEKGIGCRCGVLLRDRETVDLDDYAGDGDPR